MSVDGVEDECRCCVSSSRVRLPLCHSTHKKWIHRVTVTLKCYPFVSCRGGSEGSQLLSISVTTSMLLCSVHCLPPCGFRLFILNRFWQKSSWWRSSNTTGEMVAVCSCCSPNTRYPLYGEKARCTWWLSSHNTIPPTHTSRAQRGPEPGCIVKVAVACVMGNYRILLPRPSVKAPNTHTHKQGSRYFKGVPTPCTDALWRHSQA